MKPLENTCGHMDISYSGISLGNLNQALVSLDVARGSANNDEDQAGSSKKKAQPKRIWAAEVERDGNIDFKTFGPPSLRWADLGMTRAGVRI